MGKFLGVQEGVFAADSLNDLFGPDRIAATYATVQKLREVHNNFLNPIQGVTDPKIRRRQTLRFAGFLLTDEVVFDGVYPAPKFKKWLKWLTWIGAHQGGTLKLNGAPYIGTASQLMLEVFSKALPPVPPYTPSPIGFSWQENSHLNQFAVTATTTPGFSIDIVSPNHSEVSANDDDEDDI